MRKPSSCSSIPESISSSTTTLSLGRIFPTLRLVSAVAVNRSQARQRSLRDTVFIFLARLFLRTQIGCDIESVTRDAKSPQRCLARQGKGVHDFNRLQLVRLEFVPHP